jgi:hypothetical protein
MKTSQAYQVGLEQCCIYLPTALVMESQKETWFYGLVSSIGFYHEAGDFDRMESAIMDIMRYRKI